MNQIKKYYRARYYSPEMQRFISEDPIRLRGGINYFSYVQNSPVNWIDPFGLLCKKRGPIGDMAKGLTFGVMASGVVVWQAGKMATYDVIKAAS